MDPNRLDTVARLFARRRRSRRQVWSNGGRGSTAGAAPPAAPASTLAEAIAPDDSPLAGSGPTMLFLQSFRAGSIAAMEGGTGRHLLTLKHGLGQTIYFSDRPDRLVGTTPTPAFLAGLGFPDENPPNAALIIDNGDGNTSFAVIELFTPQYDAETHTAIYEVEVLREWEETALVFTETPTDLATLQANFGATHLFIDDCPTSRMYCTTGFTDDDIIGSIPGSSFDNLCFSPALSGCAPCTPWLEDSGALESYWAEQCNAMFDGCNGQCFGFFQCKTIDPDHPLQATMCML